MDQPARHRGKERHQLATGRLRQQQPISMHSETLAYPGKTASRRFKVQTSLT